ncbi:MAG: chromate efflux transporter [Verrucomicrobiales bacterium]
MNIFREFLILGLTAFGGPTAHIGFFRDRFVEKLKWLEESEFVDTLALCQFLPGPASSQLGFAIGWKKGGWLGAFAAWLGFTLPAAIIMTLVGIGVAKFSDMDSKGWLAGLQIAVIVVVFKALLQMAKSLCPNCITTLIAIGAAALMLWNPVSFSQIIVILAGALLGLAFLRGHEGKSELASGPETERNEGRKEPLSNTDTFVGATCLILFFGLLFGLAFIGGDKGAGGLFAAFYESGSLVFGGGHVVLPLLSEQFVTTDLLSDAEFMAGYGAAQAVPGPLFTFSSFVGAAVDGPFNPWVMSLIALVGVFLPSWLLVLGAMPFWDRVRTIPTMRAALAGTNAAVVGLLGAAIYSPVWTGAIRGTGDVIFMLGIAALLLVWKLPPWLVVIIAAVGGWLTLN